MNNKGIEWVDISTIQNNPSNPRKITAVQLKKLKESIQSFPEMLELRPLIVDNEQKVLGGNMRLTALKELGYEKVPIISVDNLTEEQKKEFIIKDNLSFGEWDWDILQNDRDIPKLEDWGMEIMELESEDKDDNNPYTKKVEAPIYTPNETLPALETTYDKSKFDWLVKKIDESPIDNEYKEYLKLCAVRHIKFNYERIADVYAHAPKEVQELMEDAALIIIDFDKAVELGYVRLGDEIMKQYKEEYGDDE